MEKAQAVHHPTRFLNDEKISSYLLISYHTYHRNGRVISCVLLVCDNCEELWLLQKKPLYLCKFVANFDRLEMFNNGNYVPGCEGDVQ
ncbi:hypothetical protein T05_6620 [Trichinella murrelli]|uniref:Uncharacterized protein n=1 Tax=Trichinella murrelli TaxID=144512 RepID=A0A0V0UFN1_9BILA|nr:hypothetical protein T05_6620 [Trichinella murrelli]